MKNHSEIPKKYKLLMWNYPLIIIPLVNELPLQGITGLIDWWMGGELTHIIKDGKFKCNYGEQLLFFSDRLRVNKNFLLFGLGNHNLLEKSALEKFSEDLRGGIRSLKVKSFALLLNYNGIDEQLLSRFFKEFAIDIYT